MKQNLFTDFQKVTKEEWINQATKDIKGKDFQKTLVTNGFDGIDLFPFYTEEDLKETQWLQQYHNRLNKPSDIPGMSPRYWSNIFAININQEATDNKRILQALMTGADALLLSVKEGVNFDVLLENVDLEYIELYLKIEKAQVSVLGSFLNWYHTLGKSHESLRGGLLWDPITSCLAEKNSLGSIVESVSKALSISEDYPFFKTLCIDSAYYHNSGASLVQQLFLPLGGYIELIDGLTEKGIEPEQMLSNTLLHAASGSDYFLEISKLRAFKILFHQLADLYQVEVKTEDVKLVVSTSFWTKSKSDVHTNMLRNTTEAMSAVLGSCDALWVRVHDEVKGEINTFSERMARNISSILKEESYLDKIMDPVAGSYFIECVTAQVIAKVKFELEILESKEGWWSTYESHQLQDLVKAARYAKMEDLTTVRKTKVGVNKYQMSEKLPVDNLMWEEENWQLLPLRESFLIEYPNLAKQ
ncbi:methylmalonyl-CoA mutase family protein [Mongoliibacter ruber]|uniref:Methylmalonyl-CoA mutase n=1 Tax=Mongoliibacter ruber TaxID=1750599 RepID=A0A2T0WLF1_9BACT|nr:methylmalonyl-CoA mutase family protein [Mongoliibacter ruber]PRY87529.1 methylmalonyl-CoA mutase [Mongoliibacter ruber]